MKPEHVLALADQAGLWYPMGGSPEALHGRERLFAFALLIEAAECERCANIARKYGSADNCAARQIAQEIFEV